ncbi:hypothetical protein LIER_12461 [Lithospermum erythrorhizon]|uniref:Uncharacterized protein n=1 Tax=Lithospermum erythrorhizon TaxID=34254 RepID=A0AAV3PUA3_LITER
MMMWWFVSSTASKRRTRANALVLERKRAALDAGEDMSCTWSQKKGYQEEQGNKDKFVVDDLEESGREDVSCITRRKSKGKMKLNDYRNRINNRRIAKGIEEMSTHGVEFNSEENEAR